MQIIFARVTLVCVDEPHDSPLLLDAAIDENDRRLVGGWTLFGSYGVDQTKEVFPFVVLKDGTVDWGSTYVEQAERYAKFNIRDRDIRKGELATYADAAGEWIYRITKVAILGERELD